MLHWNSPKCVRYAITQAQNLTFDSIAGLRKKLIRHESSIQQSDITLTNHFPKSARFFATLELADSDKIHLTSSAVVKSCLFEIFSGKNKG